MSTSGITARHARAHTEMHKHEIRTENAGEACMNTETSLFKGSVPSGVAGARE